VQVDVGLCTVSAVGVGMRSHTGVAARMFEALTKARGATGKGIAIQNITTSEIKISCILAKEDGENAMRAVHEAFGLGK
jgi:aspartate kinase